MSDITLRTAHKRMVAENERLRAKNAELTEQLEAMARVSMMNDGLAAIVEELTRAQQRSQDKMTVARHRLGQIQERAQDIYNLVRGSFVDCDDLDPREGAAMQELDALCQQMEHTVPCVSDYIKRDQAVSGQKSLGRNQRILHAVKGLFMAYTEVYQIRIQERRELIPDFEVPREGYRREGGKT